MQQLCESKKVWTFNEPLKMTMASNLKIFTWIQH